MTNPLEQQLRKAKENSKDMTPEAPKEAAEVAVTIIGRQEKTTPQSANNSRLSKEAFQHTGTSPWKSYLHNRGRRPPCCEQYAVCTDRLIDDLICRRKTDH